MKCSILLDFTAGGLLLINGFRNLERGILGIWVRFLGCQYKLYVSDSTLLRDPGQYRHDVLSFGSYVDGRLLSSSRALVYWTEVLRFGLWALGLGGFRLFSWKVSMITEIPDILDVLRV